MHMTVKSLPPFPVDPDSFLDIHRWPRRIRFEGRDLDLEYFQSRYDVAEMSTRSLSEIDSGWSYGAHYDRKLRDGKRERLVGPYYEWYPDGSILGRSYVTSSSHQSRYYDREGNLRVFDFGIRGSGCSPAKSSHELFDAEGFLVGCSMFRIKKYYWRGSEVDANGVHSPAGDLQQVVAWPRLHRGRPSRLFHQLSKPFRALGRKRTRYHPPFPVPFRLGRRVHAGFAPET